MSLNQIVANDFKFWMDPRVNSIKINNNWSYKDSDKTVGDKLVLDNSLIAQWAPLPVNNAFGNGISARIQQQAVNTTFFTLLLSKYLPFSPFYELEQDDIKIVETGTYLAMANISFSTNLSNQLNAYIEIETNTDGTFAQLLGSDISIPSGNTIFSGTDPVTQNTVIPIIAYVVTTNPNRRIRVKASCSASDSVIDAQYSYFSLFKLA